MVALRLDRYHKHLVKYTGFRRLTFSPVFKPVAVCLGLNIQSDERVWADIVGGLRHIDNLFDFRRTICTDNCLSVPNLAHFEP